MGKPGRSKHDARSTTLVVLVIITVAFERTASETFVVILSPLRGRLSTDLGYVPPGRRWDKAKIEKEERGMGILLRNSVQFGTSSDEVWV